MSRGWKNFTNEDLEQIQLPPLGVSAPSLLCPLCGESRLRWYHYRNPVRPHTKISYLWCGACRRFYGQTTFQEHWDLPDPYESCTTEERAQLEANLGKFFGELDRLWDEGVLPQEQAGQPPRRRR